MNRQTLLATLLATSALVAPLTGCVIVDKHSGMPTVGYAGATEPASVTQRYPWDQIATMDGSTLYDAHHQVKRYLTLHFPDAKLVSVKANQVGANGKIAKTSDWEFTYQVKVRPPVSPEPVAPNPVATASLTTQAVEVPTQYEVRLLTFTFTGDGKLLAPEADTRSTDAGQTIDFDRVLYFNTIIETCLDIGMGMGPAGMQVALRPTANGGAVYEVDTSVSGREVMRVPSYTKATPTPYWYDQDDYGRYDDRYDGYDGYGDRYDDRYGSGYGYSRPTPAPTPTVSPRYYRGKYVINAYTGEIIERPTRL